MKYIFAGGERSQRLNRFPAVFIQGLHLKTKMREKGMQKCLSFLLAATLMASFSVSSTAQESAPAALKEQTGQKNAIDRSFVGIPQPNIKGDGKDFSVVSFYPRVVSLKPMPSNHPDKSSENVSSADITVIFEVHEPLPDRILARVQYIDPVSNNSVLAEDFSHMYRDLLPPSHSFHCGSFKNKQPYKKFSCRIHLINLPNELTSITIYMYSYSFPEIKFASTEIKFDVQTVPTQVTQRQVIRAKNGIAIAGDNAGRNQARKARLSDNPMLNPQSIPSGRTEGTPKNSGGNPETIIFQRDKQAINPPPISPGRVHIAPGKNPGDPAPTIQNDNAIIFQRGLKNNSTASNAAVQPPSSPALTNRAMSTSAMEVGVNRFGGDYTSRDLTTAEQCRTACDGEAQCKSWSWVKPGVQGSQAKCWLKNSVPAVSKNECCVSGVK